MARSFFRPSPATQIEDFSRNNMYYHPASATYYEMLVRDGVYVQRRYQLGFDGKQSNIDEKQIDYVMGSGSHARTYLHRTPAGTLVELPLGWYAENGGFWAMSPGYDKPDHPAARREIGYDCMFCHNSYPKIPAAVDRLEDVPAYSEGPLPEGIDCQRCHGPGRRHVAAASALAGAEPAAIRLTIVNPSRLPVARQMDICLQCHLETSSAPLPHAVRKYDRGWFSYKAGEALPDFLLAFDEGAATRNPDRFEIVSSAYRLQKSECFLKSGGALKCTTCHDPHAMGGGNLAGGNLGGKPPAETYNAVCLSCHATADGFSARVASGQHTGEGACVACHMPKRRTEDVVHVVMTDHYIQRRPPARDLLAGLNEKHEPNAAAAPGHDVIPYYPAQPARTPDNEVYLAVARVRDRVNLAKGVPELERAIAAARPTRPEPYFELGGALRAQGKLAQAEAIYREALRRDPQYVPALLDLGQTLREEDKRERALEILSRATRLATRDARTWSALANVQLELGRNEEAERSYRKAAALDPDMPEAANGLGILMAQRGQSEAAEPEFRESIRIVPSYGQAHANLAELLALKGSAAEAAHEFETAILLEPEDAFVRLNYGLLLNGTRQFDRALVQLQAAVRTNPGLAQAHDVLGNLYERNGHDAEALAEYEVAVRLDPSLGSAQLDLGAALSKSGDRAGARDHLRRAAEGADPGIRGLALRLLEGFGGT
jgi:tetratricopeptide (TPR) repeat protein